MVASPSQPEFAAAVLASCRSVFRPSGPQPPEDSATIGMKATPCRVHSTSVVVPLMSFISGRGRASAFGSLDHDILSQWRYNREVKCSRRTMDPGWEKDVGGAAEIGSGRIIGARWQELWLLERRSMASASGDASGKVPHPVMAGHDITRCHAQAGMGTLDIKHSVAARAEPIVLVH